MSNSKAKQIPNLMNAIRLHKVGDPTSLTLEKVKVPKPNKDECLIKIQAASITRDELEWFPNRIPLTPSYEFSGTIEAMGSTDSNFKIGDEVYGLSPFDKDGCAAEYNCVPLTNLCTKPKDLTYIESAIIPLSALSAWQGLKVYGNLQKGQKVLIHGAAGGVGHFAIQIAKILGAYIIGTTSPEHIDTVKAFGADKLIDYKKENSFKNIDKVDLVFDTTGGERLENSLSYLKPNGKLISVAKEPPQDLSNQQIESKYFIVEPNFDQLKQITEFINQGLIQPSIDKVFKLVDAQKAFERSLKHHGPGKIVFDIS